jgi:hypothetical protein
MENHPAAIGFAIYYQMDVEVDLWFKDGYLWLGHDEPVWKVDDEAFLTKRKELLLCHAKNIEAGMKLQEMGMHWFGNNFDAFVSTSQGVTILHPQARYVPGCLVMLPEQRKAKDLGLMEDAWGFCSDDIMFYAEYFG